MSMAFPTRVAQKAISVKHLLKRQYETWYGADRARAGAIPNVGDTFVFVHIPKNAGSSVADTLGLATTYHRTAGEYRAMLGRLRFGRRFVFAFARNPWSRFLSLYHYARLEESRYHSALDPASAPYGKHADYDLLTGASLDDCARYLLEGRLRHDANDINHWRPQVDWVTDADGSLLVDFVGRVEAMDASFRVVAERLNLDVKTLPVANRSRSSHGYRDVFSPVARDVVAEYYREDIDAFGYTF
jgi:hypothetical protein